MATSSTTETLELEQRIDQNAPLERNQLEEDLFALWSITEREHPVLQLEPADGGYAAWRMLAAALVFEAVLWGEISSLL
jgi:hypothetical protein